jgi:asparagine synthase (glutamine-hydrolysing)
MYNSLEVRAPFLDTNVVDLANSLPLKLKLRGLTTKYILKKMMQDKLPKEIVWRKKKGFGVPVAHWISNELKPLILEKLSAERINREGLFEYSEVKRILNEHFSGQKDNRKQIWALLVFELWQEKWLK